MHGHAQDTWYAHNAQRVGPKGAWAPESAVCPSHSALLALLAARMAPKKRTRRQETEVTAHEISKSPRKKQRSSSEDVDGPATLRKSKKITWRLLTQDVTTNLNLEAVEDDEVNEDNTFTAHYDQHNGARKQIDWLQQGASEAGHVEDVVAMNDVFAGKVDELLDLCIPDFI